MQWNRVIRVFAFICLSVIGVVVLLSLNQLDYGRSTQIVVAMPEIIIETPTTVSGRGMRCQMTAPVGLSSLARSFAKQGRAMDLALDIVVGMPRRQLVRRTLLAFDQVKVRRSDVSLVPTDADTMIIYEKESQREKALTAPISSMQPVLADGTTVKESFLFVYDFAYTGGDKRSNEAWNLVLVERDSSVHRELAFTNTHCEITGT